MEAAARRARVDLVLAPVVPGGDRRLISRFLGIEPSGRIVLAIPETPKGQRVFLPIGWRLGMSFELANIWFQAPTTVVEHRMFQQFAARRVDALSVAHPKELLSANRRSSPRSRVDPSKPFTVTIWSAHRTADEHLAPIQVGRLQDWSDIGLGVKLTGQLPVEPGTRLILCLERAATNECVFVWGRLTHCTAADDGWLAGFGDVTNMGPGEAVELMAFMAAAAR